MTETTNNILGENMLPLAEIAKPVFNITPRIAQRKAATNTLPVPAFRIGGTRKGPLYVLKLGIAQAVHAHSAKACAGEAGFSQQKKPKLTATRRPTKHNAPPQ